MSDENNKTGNCIFCSKPDSGIPPTYGEHMCQECWATKTEEGKLWVEEYYSREAYHEDIMRDIHDDYYRRQPDESPDGNL